MEGWRGRGAGKGEGVDGGEEARDLDLKLFVRKLDRTSGDAALALRVLLAFLILLILEAKGRLCIDRIPLLQSFLVCP